MWAQMICLATVKGSTPLSRRLFVGAAASKFAPAQIEPTPPARIWVRLRDDRGRPTAARVYVRASDGKFYAPTRALAREIARSKETFFHAADRFQIEVPAGECVIEAVKGFEYVRASETLRIQPGQVVHLDLVLRRSIDMQALGWRSGDVHMHPNHVQYGVYMTMEDCLLYAQAEDIRVANLLISSAQSGHVFDTEYFNGGKPEAISTDETMLVVQQEFRNTSAMYGHMPLLGITKLVEPFFTGEPDSEHWEDYPPNYTAARAAKDQGGAVCYTHPAKAAEIPVGPHLAREFPIDLALGVVDALDVLGNGDEVGACWMYYRVLNCGLKCAASSGSDSRMDVLRHLVSGGGKVYVKSDGPLTYKKWVADYKAGKTFVTNGPMLFLTVNDKEPGSELRLGGPSEVQVTARAISQLPMTSIELVVNGEVAASAKPSRDGKQAEIVKKIHLPQSSWIAARVSGDGHRLVVNDPKLFAHTSPVYCYVGGRKIASREDARIVVDWIDRLIQDVVASPRFANDRRRNEVVKLFERGREYFQQQARDQIERSGH
jgi:TolB protein